MGIFSKIKRGFKKIVKKVGRGIKKVAKGIGKVLGRIAKPFQKLGILGQIALSFIMPWAVGGIMKGMGYLASSSFGATAATWAKSSNLFVKAAGTLAKGINYGAAAVNKAYTFISDGISTGLDWVSEQGTKIKDGLTDKFDAAKEWVTGNTDTPDLATIDLSETTAGLADGVTGTVLDTSKLKFDPIEIGTGTGIDMSQVGSKVSILNTNKIAADTIAEQSKNTLTRHGERLIGAGTKAASKVFTFDTAKNEIVKAAEQQKEEGYRSSYEEGPTVAYLEVTPEKVTRDIDFSVKAQGGQYMSPLDSLQIMENIRYV